MTHAHSPFAALCRGLAHELSNVLTYLLPAIQEARACHEGVDDEISADDLRRVDHALELAGCRLSQMFRELRMGHAEPRPGQPVDLQAALAAAIGDLPAGEDPGVSIYIEEGGGERPVLVRADPVLLHEALSRVMRAAVGWAQTCRPAAQVAVALALVPPDRAGLAVMLRGDGLPEARRLLEMSCPAESGAVRAERGMLGVLLAQWLIQAHGGALRAESAADGVGFRVELPLDLP